MNLKRQLSSFLRVPERVTLLFAGRADGSAAPVTPADPLPVTVMGGSGGSAPVQVTDVYAPQVLTPGAQQALSVPPGANRALLRVSAGRAQFGLLGTADAPLVGEGGGLDDLRDLQLHALRVTVEAGGAVRVDYWREGTYTLEVM
ncbi:hypothetical protein [Deinococcus knuensis]|uniref:Uncharacterized protein n=1 Tax=Deinococcus knuensis TaxID=1837380 RepID=A0ABQ2STL8_9DEIO|nr:hypothetical protein [Deinococcus knuensis]GGS37758.1 hypothetical protein GCM10008961_31610 [Deinococcus knuensis]